MGIRRYCEWLAVIGVVQTLLAASATAEPAGQVDFERDVWPVLQSRCITCHGPEKQKSSLRVDSREALLKGGDSGPALVAGNPAKSYLIELVSAQGDDLRMPPEGDPLAANQIAAIRQWIAGGANWPANAGATRTEAPHWAFQPVARPAVPEIKDERLTTRNLTSRNPIDAFVAASLRERGLQMSPPAEPRTFIRRVTLDLTGLPPTPEEVEEFVRSCAPTDGTDAEAKRHVDITHDPYQDLVNRLLASSGYGQRWAQHWLDVIRYADTTGYESNAHRSNAWPYRDYVISALNSDVPYPRFILEQLAGDTRGVDPATGFLVSAPFPSRIEVGQEAAAIAQARFNGLDEVVQNISSAILGVTVGCARCHDHKFDPVSMRDYYRLVATFAGLQFVDRPWHSGARPTQEILAAEARLAGVRRKLRDLPAWRETEPIGSADFFQPVPAQWIRLTVKDTFTGKGYAPAIDEIEIWTPGDHGEPTRNVASAQSGASVRSSGADLSLACEDSFLNDGKLGSRSRWVARDRLDAAEAWVEVELPQALTIDRVAWSCDHDDQAADLVAAKWRTLKKWQVEVAVEPGQWRTVVSVDRKEDIAASDAERRTALERQYAQAATQLWELTHIFAGRFRAPEPSYVLRRGNPQEPREPAGPGGIDALGGYELPLDAAESERRIALAHWLGSERNPLTARVLVNRVWRHHFGSGLVDTPSDFGTQGERPTHPELLDWLASEFMQRGWKLKELHRLICTSQTYRQSSRPNAAAAAIDADARLLWRFPPRRLEADAIRDSILFASGSLDLTMGGPGKNIYRPRPKENGGDWLPKENAGQATWRRTIYLLRARGADDGLFKPFDVPDCGQVRAKRGVSTTPLQALNLFNSPFIVEQAQRLAVRAQRESGDDMSRQIERVFALTLARAPSDQEREVCGEAAKVYGLATVCRALFNSNEFLFLE